MIFTKFKRSNTKLFMEKMGNAEYIHSRECGLLKQLEFELPSVRRDVIKFSLLLAMVGIAAFIKFGDYYLESAMYLFGSLHIALIIALIVYAFAVLSGCRKKFEREHPDDVKYYRIDYICTEETNGIVEIRDEITKEEFDAFAGI